MIAYGARLEVWGDYACFTRPDLKVERVSYDVITPSAARGILEAIYWKPQMRWRVDRIMVLNPIRYASFRRNEVKHIVPRVRKSAMRQGKLPAGIDVAEHRTQRNAKVLKDVRYVIEAHVEVVEPRGIDGNVPPTPEGKHLNIFTRRAKKGLCFHRPYLGCREFPAHFRLVSDEEAKQLSCPEELRGVRDLGWMLWDTRYLPDKKGKVVDSNQGRRLRPDVRFFHAVMQDGVIDIPPEPKA